MNDYKAQYTDGAAYVGVIEFQSQDEEWRDFTIVKTDTHIIFGSPTNNTFLESGSYLMDDCVSFDENLRELLADLESYYDDDGTGYQSDNFSYNDRM